MKTSKTLLSVVLAVLTIGLASCDGGNKQTTTPAGSDTTSSREQHEYAISVSGEAKAGNELSFILKVDGKTVNQSNVTYSTNAGDKATINGNKITFSEAGTYTVTATYNGQSSSTEVTIAEGEKIYTIAEVIAEAEKGNTGAENLFTVQGKITASAGTSAYIADKTGAMYIFNWTYNNNDTAIKNKKFVAGDSVQLTCFVTSYNNGAWQFSNYSSGRLDGTSALLLDKEVEVADPIELTEASFKTLTKADNAKVYTFEAEYVSGAPTATGNNVSTKFKLGETEITLYYSKYDSTLPASATTLTAGSKYTITTPMSWYNSGSVAQFAYTSDGTTITEIVKPLEVTYTGKARVGKTLTLTTKASGTAVTEGVTYSLTAGSEYATLNAANGTLVLKAAGQVTVQASYTANGTTLTDSLTFTIAEALTYTSLAGLSNLATDTDFTTDAYLLGMSKVYSGKYTYVYLGNGANGFYLYNVDEALLSGIAVGDLIRVEGTYDADYLEGKNIDYVEKLAENTNGVLAATEISYTAENAEALATTDSGRKVTLTNAKVAALSIGSKDNVTATLKLNNVEYSLYLNSNYNDVTVAKTLKVGYNVTLTGFAAYNSSSKTTRIQTLSSMTIEESFILDKTSAQIVMANADKTVQLTSEYKGNLTGITVTWASSDTAVATVSEAGLVTGVAVGTATITATYGTLTATCEITVVAEADPVVTINSDGFADSDYQTSGNGLGYTKTIDGITLTCASGSGSLWSASAGKTIRVFSNKTLNISSAIGKMYKIEFTYSSSTKGKLTGTGYDSDSNTWTSATGENSVDFTGNGGTVQITKILVTYKAD